MLVPPLAPEPPGETFTIFHLGDYGESPGLGLLRLHSTFRHDLKIYASDEGRVQMTAAAFAKVKNLKHFCSAAEINRV